MMERFLKFKLKQETASFVLFCVAAVLAFGVFVKLTDYFVSSAKAEGLIKRAVEQNKDSQQPTSIEQLCAASKTIADNLKRKNLFAIGTAQKENPVREVTGIFGSEVLISGRWYRLGERVDDAEIVAIEPARVRIKWQGNERTFTPITNETQQPAGQGREGQTTAMASRGGRRGATDTTGRGMSQFGPGGFGGFSQMSEQDRAQVMQRMSEMRQRFQNMTDQERQDYFNQMRSQFGGRGGRGGGMGGPGGGMGGPGGDMGGPPGGDMSGPGGGGSGGGGSSGGGGPGGGDMGGPGGSQGGRGGGND